MQINGTSCSTLLYPTKSCGNDVHRRLPVVVDNNDNGKQQAYGLAAVERLPATKQAQFSQGTFDSSQHDAQSQQQARFVRLSAKLNEQADSNSQADLSSGAVPTGIQQYLQIANLNHSSQQGLIDEIV